MREEILAYKRDRILEEAVKLFYERGFTGTTLDDIAAELGVTKPFIYTHFRSKTDLLAALCKPTIELSREAVSRAAEMHGTPTARLHRAIADFTQVLLSRQANIAIYFREEKNLASDALDEINALPARVRLTGEHDEPQVLCRVIRWSGAYPGEPHQHVFSLSVAAGRREHLLPGPRAPGIRDAATNLHEIEDDPSCPLAAPLAEVAEEQLRLPRQGAAHASKLLVALVGQQRAAPE